MKLESLINKYWNDIRNFCIQNLADSINSNLESKFSGQKRKDSDLSIATYLIDEMTVWGLRSLTESFLVYSVYSGLRKETPTLPALDDNIINGITYKNHILIQKREFVQSTVKSLPNYKLKEILRKISPEELSEYKKLFLSKEIFDEFYSPFAAKIAKGSKDKFKDGGFPSQIAGFIYSGEYSPKVNR